MMDADWFTTDPNHPRQQFREAFYAIAEHVEPLDDIERVDDYGIVHMRSGRTFTVEQLIFHHSA